MSNEVVVKPAEYERQMLDLLRVSFGYKRLYYLPNINRTPKGLKADYAGLTALESKFENRAGFLNTPIIAPLKVQISAKGEELQYYTFPNEPIVEIRGAKRIVETELDGQDGSFKELYSLGDYAITIRGVAVDENYNNEDYPEEIIRNLRTVFELKHHVEVVHPILNLFNIKYLTMKEFNIVPQPGAISMQPYEFLCSSDKEYKLELKKKSEV